MGAIAFCPQSLLSFNKQLKLGNTIFFPKRARLIFGYVNKLVRIVPKIADWPSPFAIQKIPHKFTVLNINSDGSRRGGPPCKGSTAGKTNKEDGNEMPQLSKGNRSSFNQDEIIGLFRRIQSSISKEEPESKKKRNPSSSKGKTRNKLKDSSLVKDEVIDIWRSNVVKKEQEIQSKEPNTDIKLTRLPSNFVKRSPIPSPSTPRGKVPKLKSETEASNGIVARKEELILPRSEELKLTELKELAKARGIKGYSRLKKSELVRLLRS